MGLTQIKTSTGAGNAWLIQRGRLRDDLIRAEMGEWNFPDGFTVKDIIATIGLGGLFDSERQVRDHMRTMADRFKGFATPNKSGATVYKFQVNLYMKTMFLMYRGATMHEHN